MNASPLFVKIALVLGAVLGLAGCPLQSPTFESGSPGVVVSASTAAPLVDDTITLTALAPAGGASPNDARWSTSDPSIVSLVATSGASIMAHAQKVGTARIGVVAGGFQSAVTVTVLDSIGGVVIDGPGGLKIGDEVQYSATVTDVAARTVPATLTWGAAGAISFASPDGNTGASMRFKAVGLGAGVITAQAAGHTTQIAVTVSATRGQLVIRLPDGSAVPDSVALGDALTLAAKTDVTKQDVDAAQWTASGACTLVGASGATVSIEETGAGSCTVAATTKDAAATVTFAIVTVTSVKITGETGPFAIGESRTFTAVGLAEGAESGTIAVTWSTPDEQVLSLQPSGATVRVTGIAVGEAQLVVKLGNKAMASVDLVVAPSSIQISAPGTHVLSGASTTITALAFGPRGAAARFTSAASLSLSGATGFTTVGSGVVQGDGSVTFALAGAKADSPGVKVSFGAVASNALSFSIAEIARVVISGPQGPVRVGSTVDFTAVPVDASGARIDAAATATWADASGVYQFPADAQGLKVTATVVKLGTASIVATVHGIASPPFASPAQPASVNLAPFSPASIAVGGKATTTVTVLDSNGAPIPGVTLDQLSIKADDGTKVSFDAGAVMGTGFVFTATGLAPTAGVNVTATWTDGMFPVDSGGVPLAVTGP